MYVCEIFNSIQGEGPNVGKPSVFVRFALCNLKCPGFGVEYNGKKGCDSFYSVDIDYKDNWIKYDKFEDLRDDILKVIETNDSTLRKPEIVFTGGEPLLHWNTPMFQHLIEYFISRGYLITIETNGTIDITFSNDYQKQIQFSVSPKLLVSGEKYEKRINKKALNNIFINTKKSYLKFVVSKEDINNSVMDEIKDILDGITVYTDVYIMPLGDTLEKIKENELSVLDFCLDNNFNYSDRLHIRLWGNKRGV